MKDLLVPTAIGTTALIGSPKECTNESLMYILICLIVIFLTLTLAHVFHMYLRCINRRKRLKKLIEIHSMRKEKGDDDVRITDKFS